MKITIQPKPREVELTDAQVNRLREIGEGHNYYWTSGEDGERLDELERMGLVYTRCGGGGDEIYRLTDDGRIVFQRLPPKPSTATVTDED